MHTMAAQAAAARAPLSAQLRPATPGFTGSSRVALKPLRRTAFLVRPRAAAGEPEDGTPSELQRGVVLGVLMAKAFGKSTDSQPAVEEEAETVKPGGVVSAALAALMLVRTLAARARPIAAGAAGWETRQRWRIRSLPPALRRAPALMRHPRAPGERAHGSCGGGGQGGPVPVAGACPATRSPPKAVG